MTLPIISTKCKTILSVNFYQARLNGFVFFTLLETRQYFLSGETDLPEIVERKRKMARIKSSWRTRQREWATRPTVSQLWSFQIRRITFFYYIKFANLLILKLWNSEEVGRVKLAVVIWRASLMWLDLVVEGKKKEKKPRAKWKESFILRQKRGDIFYIKESWAEDEKRVWRLMECLKRENTRPFSFHQKLAAFQRYYH